MIGNMSKKQKLFEIINFISANGKVIRDDAIHIAWEYGPYQILRRKKGGKTHLIGKTIRVNIAPHWGLIRFYAGTKKDLNDCHLFLFPDKNPSRALTSDAPV